VDFKTAWGCPLTLLAFSAFPGLPHGSSPGSLSLQHVILFFRACIFVEEAFSTALSSEGTTPPHNNRSHHRRLFFRTSPAAKVFAATPVSDAGIVSW
jgi:hypothetical protein